MVLSILDYLYNDWSPFATLACMRDSSVNPFMRLVAEKKIVTNSATVAFAEGMPKIKLENED